MESIHQIHKRSGDTRRKNCSTHRTSGLAVRANEELRWLGHLFIPGLFDGEHIFELYENTDGSTTFVQREKFTGLLVSLFEKMLDTNTLAGFEAMNKKLKALAEEGLS
jgi:hypothetical protein